MDTAEDAPTNRRDRLRAATEVEIKQVARAQLGASGGTELSLRGIAREMGMTAPALYRYFENLSALSQAMCHDYMDEVTAEIGAALEDAGDDTASRMLAAIRTFRRWALAHPAEFGLLFRSKGPGPIAFPDQAAWMEDECPHVMAFANLFLELFVGLWETAPFDLPDASHLPPAALEQAAEFGRVMNADLPTPALMLFVHAWIRVYSIVALEVLGQLDFMLKDVEPFFEAELAAITASMGLRYAPPVSVG